MPTVAKKHATFRAQQHDDDQQDQANGSDLQHAGAI
jgi:hypothetical protein